MSRALALVALLAACDPVLAPVDTGGGLDAPTDTPIDAPRVDGGTPDAPLGCVTAATGFPRAIGLPEPTPDGVFDPDLARDPATGRIWASYSAVLGAPGTGRVSTHLAYSDDDGASWCYAGVVNPAETVTDLPSELAGARAHWSHETSSLSFEEGAPADARWRLAWHRYLHVDGESAATARHFEHGWIAERVAATPEGLASAPERKLFSASLYHQPGIEAWNDAAPGGAPSQRLDGEGCAIVVEPTFLSVGGELLSAVHCARSATDRTTELYAFDRALGEWAHRGRLLAASDAGAIGAGLDGINAAELVAYGGGVRLVVTPTLADIYRGCAVFELDAALGALVDATGDGPDLRYFLPLGGAASAPFGGACSFLEGSALGLVYSELHTTRPTFNAMATGTVLLESP